MEGFGSKSNCRNMEQAQKSKYIEAYLIVCKLILQFSAEIRRSIDVWVAL